MLIMTQKQSWEEKPDLLIPFNHLTAFLPILARSQSSSQLGCRQIFLGTSMRQPDQGLLGRRALRLGPRLAL